MDEIERKRKLFVGGLPKDTENEDLKTLFSGFGTVEKAYVVRNYKNGKTRGFGFVVFESKVDYLAVLGLQELTLKGKRLFLMKTNTKTEIRKKVKTKIKLNSRKIIQLPINIHQNPTSIKFHRLTRDSNFNNQHLQFNDIQLSISEKNKVLQSVMLFKSLAHQNNLPSQLIPRGLKKSEVKRLGFVYHKNEPHLLNCLEDNNFRQRAGNELDVQLNFRPGCLCDIPFSKKKVTELSENNQMKVLHS